MANTSELLIQGDELPFQLFGTQYLISKNGLAWKQLASESVLKELGPLKWNDLENMTCESLFKNVRNGNMHIRMYVVTLLIGIPIRNFDRASSYMYIPLYRFEVENLCSFTDCLAAM